MLNLVKLKEFYQTYPVDLSFLTHCSWRQFRFVLPSGRFWKLPVQIKDNKTFNAFLLRRKPLDVYYSTSCWLAPINVGARSNILSKNLFLFSDLIFDIDGQNSRTRSIEKARKESIKLVNFLDNQNIVIKYISFSGSKGFHIVCEDPVEYEILCPLEREKKTKELSKNISLQVLDLGIKIDSRVTVDTRRILRVPGTINSKSGYSCRIITREELFKYPAREIIKNTKRINLSFLGKPRRSNQLFKSLQKIFHKYREKIGVQPPPFYYASFLSNKVVSTKLFVPIIEFNKTSESRVISLLLSIMETYKLSDAFLFKGDDFFAILPFALQKRRIEKILQAANSQNIISFKKYNQTFTRISAKVDLNLNPIANRPIFIRHVKFGGLEKPVSASHLQFLLNFGIQSKKFNRSIGSEEYIIRHTLIEN